MLEYIDTADGGYRPGVCNIGPAEIRRRRQIGWLGVAGTLGLALLLPALEAPAASGLLLAIPAAGAFSGFIQAHLRFCAGFGLAGMQNLGALGDEQRVEDAGARSADRRKALLVHAASMAAGLGVALAFTLISI
jgi:hypothetical protein